jgi:hypothetical protein
MAFAVAAAWLLCTPNARADAFPDGGGIVYGEGYAFNLKAPKGWTLDTSAGVSQKLNAVFYPNGNNWADSPIVAYAQSRPKTPTIQNGDDAAKDTIRRFHQEGNSPNYQGTKLKTLKADGGAEAVLYQFSGDQWGNYEVAAYFAEKDRINFLVMNSRDKKLFDQSLPAFEALAKSYLPMTISITPPKK